ncbi:hypothetical protein EMIT0P253_70026 [Pseudomonas sp. IT-P253]
MAGIDAHHSAWRHGGNGFVRACYLYRLVLEIFTGTGKKMTGGTSALEVFLPDLNTNHLWERACSRRGRHIQH